MIEIKNLSFNYSKQQELFNDLIFEQKKGSITGLLGKNGAGKSTLLSLISGLAQPKKGSIYVNGFIPYKRDPNFLSDIFIVTDDPFLPPLTIKNYTKVFAPLYKNFDLEKMNRVLETFELKENYKLDKISHGQQKKFIIAFALASNCKILLLDEPTNGLDIPSKSIFRKILVSSVDEDQLVLISTHQVKDIESIIDKIVILENGEIIFEKDTLSISKNLQFKKLTSMSSVSDVLYHEKCPEGFDVITTVTNQEETEINIELLFNAIMNKTEITF